ncbi:MAG: PAS domain-containing protein [Candidatus Obscuribacterales bacterium]|nr:PAS domain-containing protein [Candidatus Obscuribacterales bacterium]
MYPDKGRSSGLPAGNLSEEEIESRKKWLDLSKTDEAKLREFDPVLTENCSEIIAGMYRHFLSFEETRAFFPNDEVLNRAKTAQHTYFTKLCKAPYNQTYVQERLRVGDTHHRIGLDPKWYLGAYCSVLNSIRQLLLKTWPGNYMQAFDFTTSLIKVIFFDMGLAIESYIRAKEQAIREQRDALAELNTERKVVRSMLENAPVGIVRLDSNLHCQECNEEFLQILGIDSQEFVEGKSLFELAPYLSRGIFKEIMDTAQPSSRNADLLSLSITAEPSYWDWSAWPVKDENGRSIGMVAIFSNVSDRVLLQQQREDFVATLTHDLKTPILAANRAVKLLMEGDFGAVSEQQSKVLETIHQSNEAMYKMVQTLLDVYRYDSGAKKLNLQQQDLSACIKQLIDELNPLLKAKNVTLNPPVMPNAITVICDLEEIRRVLQNLLDNSLKFTPGGGQITVDLKQSDFMTTISVKDTGKGISDEDKPKLFQRFWQAASSGRYYASTGLGLYLCKKIVEHHGGKIWCESQVGKGSTFTFTISNKGKSAESSDTDN